MKPWQQESGCGLAGHPCGAAGSCRQLCWQEAAQTPRFGTCLHPTSQVGKLRHSPARWGWGCEALRWGWVLGVLHGRCLWRVVSRSGCSCGCAAHRGASRPLSPHSALVNEVALTGGQANHSVPGAACPVSTHPERHAAALPGGCWGGGDGVGVSGLP